MGSPNSETVRDQLQRCLMCFLKLVCTALLICPAAWIAVAQTKSPSAGLPSLTDLQKLKFSQAAAPNVTGAPSYSGLQEAISSFRTFHDASPNIAHWKWNELPKARGPNDSEVYYKAVNAAVFIAK